MRDRLLCLLKTSAVTRRIAVRGVLERPGCVDVNREDARTAGLASRLEPLSGPPLAENRLDVGPVIRTW